MTHDKIPELLQRLDENTLSSLNYDCAATIRQLLRQLPADMMSCTFECKSCAKGHNWIQPSNWLDHGCSICAQQDLQKELVEVRAQALAAVWLTQADTCIEELNNLREEAREVFMGADKQTIAKLQDRVAALESDLRTARCNNKSPIPRITRVYGVKEDNDLRVTLPITRLNRLQSGSVELEVLLP